MKILLKVSVVIGALASATGPAAASVIANLSADWSNVNNPDNSNPNGT